jgi:hypothetical protein
MSKKIKRGDVEMSDAEFKSIKAKTDLVMSMAGANPETALTVLSHALIFTTLKAGVLFSSVVRNLAEMYEDTIEQHNDKGDEDGNEGG